MRCANNDEYIQRMAIRAKEKAKKIRDERAAWLKRLVELDAELIAIQRECPHMNLTRHHRPSAECSGWDECKDCGAEL